MTHRPAGCGAGATRATTPESRSGGARGGLALIVGTITGAVLLLVGVAMLVLPGPGLLVIVASLAVLAVDYVWARRLRGHATERLAASGRTVRRAATAPRGRRHDDLRDCDGVADTDNRDVQDRDSRRGAEHPTSVERS